MNEDFLDLLTALTESDARFLVVGAHAMAVHGVPRATGDVHLEHASQPFSCADLGEIRALISGEQARPTAD